MTGARLGGSGPAAAVAEATYLHRWDCQVSLDQRPRMPFAVVDVMTAVVVVVIAVVVVVVALQMCSVVVYGIYRTTRSTPAVPDGDVSNGRASSVALSTYSLRSGTV